MELDRSDYKIELNKMNYFYYKMADFKPPFMDLKYEQDRAYYESLEKDMEKDFQTHLAEIARMEREEREKIEEIKKKELKMELDQKLEKEKEQNQPSKEEMRQRRLNFYEKNK